MKQSAVESFMKSLAAMRDTLSDKIKSEVIGAHNPALSQIDGKHVFQLWSDGEITKQKGGSLLNQRSLHSFNPGFAFPSDQMMLDIYNLQKSDFPIDGSIYCTGSDALRIRQLMAQYHMVVLALDAQIPLEFLPVEADPEVTEQEVPEQEVVE